MFIKGLNVIKIIKKYFEENDELLRIAGIATEIRTEQHRNTSLTYYLCISHLGGRLVK
jgi:hypothetical protein